ncbi:Xaa-Pro peptidase family protein [Saccharopolyspora shandongensis]|uniref:M24 family metallopeptidase n=1 Tax=Saccharopolyspora shandongensis TaxID=418495 RepID=UPI0034450666
MSPHDRQAGAAAAPGPTVPPEILARRLHRVVDWLAADQLDAAVLCPGSDLEYLLGVSHGTFERPTFLLVTPDAVATLLVPHLEADQYRNALTGQDIDQIGWADGDDPYARAVAGLGRARRVAVSGTMPARHILQLQRRLDPECVLVDDGLSAVRAVKDTWEVQQLTLAGAALDRVHARLPDLLAPGRTEAAIGQDIAEAMADEGFADVGFVSVASGPNGAIPHHTTSTRRLEPADVVVVDISGPLPTGYHADSTRTYALGTPPSDVSTAYAALTEAFDAARHAARPGVAAGAVDAAARDVLDAAGLARQFLHRTGHGIGLEVHELPYITPGSPAILQPGMAFSIEPGIYFPGAWGARIEDIVVLGETGAVSVNHRPRALLQVG